MAASEFGVVRHRHWVERHCGNVRKSHRWRTRSLWG